MIESLDIDIREKVHPNGLVTLRDLAFHARGGEFIAIVGPSGAGKTTLLKILCGLDADVNGTVRVNPGGLPIDRARPRIGYVFQEPRLMPWLNVRENIELVITQQPTLEGKINALLDQVGLGDFTDAYPGQLSGGMQRRVALARAFIVQPELLLLDEAFQSLDDPTAAGLRGLLTDLWREHSPLVFFVTHQLREALALADRILFVSARPATLVLDLPINLPRPRGLESDAVNRLHAELLARHPRLLSGEVSGSAVGPSGQLPDNPSGIP